MSAMSAAGNDRDHVQSLERGFAVLRSFDAEHPNPTLGEIATITGLARPVVRRLLLTLRNLGYVEHRDGRWQLTPRVLSIGEHYTTSHALIDTAQPHMVTLAEQAQESVSLGALDDTEVVYIARVPIRRILNTSATPGTRAPIHATSLGRILLAWAPDQEVERIISTAGLPKLTPYTVTDAGQFREALATVRRQGWAMVVDEREEGLITLSAPVHDRTGEVVAALASSTSTGRSTPEQVRQEMVPELRRTASRISADLGHTHDRKSSSLSAHSHEGFF